MRGRIIKLADSHYRIIISLPRDAITGKYKQKWLTVRGNRDKAERKLTELLYQMDNGAQLDASKIRLADYLNMWLKDIQGRVRFDTHRRYTEICNMYLSPELGQIPLANLRKEDCRRYLTTKLSQGMNISSLYQHRAVLHQALKDAVDRELLPQNVCSDLHLPPRPVKEMNIWNVEQFNQFLSATKDNPLYPFFYLDMFTGMRRSELLGLQWGDIDWTNNAVSVRRGYHSRGIFKGFLPPKSKKSIRLIPLPPSAAEILKDLYLQTQQNGKRSPLASQGVFWDGNTPPSPNMISKAWQRACVKAGVPVIRLHDVRHTHASMLLKMGVHIKIVQERLGHSSAQITADIYSHIMPGLQQQAAEDFDRLVNPKTDTK